VDTIHALNQWIKAYAHQEGLIYVDYYTPLEDAHHGFQAKLTEDGVHPNDAGFAIMSRLAKQAMKEALSTSAP
jgi:lysophospholipase L1-like esterase